MFSPTLPPGQELLFILLSLCLGPISVFRLASNPDVPPLANVLAPSLGIYNAPSPNFALPVALRLSNNPLTAAGVDLLMDGLAGNTSVTHLSLLHTDLGDEGLELLAAQLDSNKQLQELNVAYNGAGDTVALALAKAAREHPSLELLQ